MNFKVLILAFAAVAYASSPRTSRNSRNSRNSKNVRSSRNSRNSDNLLINPETEICRSELEGIVYNPETCANQYLARITKELEVASPIIFADHNQAQALLEQFQQKYGVTTYLMDAFGNYLQYPGGPIVTNIPQGGHAIERAFALGHAFSNFESENFFNIPASFVYTTLLWSPTGEMYTLAVLLDKQSGSAVLCK